jgi:hypothetical protein
MATDYSPTSLKIVLVVSLLAMMLGIYAGFNARFRDVYFRGRHLEAGTRITRLSPLMWSAMCAVVALFATMSLKGVHSERLESVLGWTGFGLVIASLATSYYEYRRRKRERHLYSNSR